MTRTETIIDRLRAFSALAEQTGRFVDARAARDVEAYINSLTDALTAALTAAHAARDAAERRIEACESMIRQHAKAADIFQPGGKFHEHANLLLGDSAVAAGIAWLTDEHDRLTAQLTTALRERDEARDALARYQAEHAKRRP